jgi:hypothetical protein
MLQVRAVQSIGVEKDGHGLVERDAVFRRVGIGLPRIPLEHNSVYTECGVRLAAVRRVAYEAADAGLLSPEPAGGIRRVDGVRRLGVRVGSWLTPEQGRRLLEHPQLATPRQLRDHPMLGDYRVR